MDLITTNICREDKEKVYETILYWIEARMSERILIGTFGAMSTNDETTQGYCAVKWMTEPYTVEEDTVMKGVERQQSTLAGEIICDAVFWNPLSNVINWYTPMSKREGLVMIRLMQVLITGMTMKMISDKNMLPNKCNKKQATNQGSMKIDNDDVCEIIEEVYRIDKFTKELDIGLISESEDDENISEDEEESSGDDTH